jgi:hypothetical protein
MEYSDISLLFRICCIDAHIVILLNDTKCMF